MSKLLLRGRQGLQAYNVPPCTTDTSIFDIAKVEGCSDNSTVMIPDESLVFDSTREDAVTKFSDDGTRLAVSVVTVGITVYDTASGAVVMQKDHPTGPYF
jgi:hypothetical protein